MRIQELAKGWGQPVVDPGGPRGPPPDPVKISHKKMTTEVDCIDFMFLATPSFYPAAGSAADTCL